MEKNKIVIIDYDDTYTLEPELFDRFIYQLKSRGYKIVCATMRYDIPDEADEVKQLCPAVFDSVIFTGRQAKIDFINRMNLKPCLYIDDSPQSLFLNAQQSFGKET